jgi:hypothetical protein
MQEAHLFEYAVIRIVPRVEREEFLNVGVVLYCARRKFLQAMFDLDTVLLSAFSPALDIDELREYLCAFERISAGGNDAGPIGRLPAGERFRWLTATRSTVVQTSKVHPGLCSEPLQMLTKLHGQLVIRKEH